MIGQFLYNSKGDDKKSDDAPAQSEDHTNVEPTPRDELISGEVIHV